MDEQCPSCNQFARHKRGCPNAPARVGRRGRRTLGPEEQTVAVGAKVPQVVAAALKAAAVGNYESDASYIRRILIERLRADGLLPPVALFKE